MPEYEVHAPDVRDVDVIYRETDRLYYEFARGCGLSTVAFWSLVSVVVGDMAQVLEGTALRDPLPREPISSSVATPAPGESSP